MSSDDDDSPLLDLDEFTLPGGSAPLKGPKRLRQRREHFVSMSWKLIEAAVPHFRDKSWVVLMQIVYETWRHTEVRKRQGYTIKLPNQFLKRLGISRHTKYLALRKLEAAKIISVDWRDKKSPLVTLLVRLNM